MRILAKGSLDFGRADISSNTMTHHSDKGERRRTFLFSIHLLSIVHASFSTYSVRLVRHGCMKTSVVGY